MALSMLKNRMRICVLLIKSKGLDRRPQGNLRKRLLMGLKSLRLPELQLDNARTEQHAEKNENVINYRM